MEKIGLGGLRACEGCAFPSPRIGTAGHHFVVSLLQRGRVGHLANQIQNIDLNKLGSEI